MTLTFLLLFSLYIGKGYLFTAQGTLDLNELHSVQYNVEILDTPVEDSSVDTETQSVSPSVTMVNKDGQRYRCSLPQIPEANADSEDKTEEKEVDVAKLLSPLESSACLYKTKDWWTYEICYNRAIKQYHVENEKPVGAVMVLGVHSPEMDSWGQTNKTYQPQWYTNGSKCDLTGRPRETELRFVCNEAATQEFIGDIFEPQSCEYTIVVHTSKLCSVPWLRPVADPTPLPIVCNPLLSHSQMAKYKVYQERKKVAEELAAKERKAKKEAELARRMGAKQVANSGSETSLAGLLNTMGDNVADNLVMEINTLLEKAMAGDGNMNVVDLRDRNKLTSKESKEIETEDKESNKKNEASAVDGKWDLIHNKHQPVSDPELQDLINERNNIWRKTHEAKKMVKKYTSQLHDTETFLKNEKSDAFQSKEIITNLEEQKERIENTLVKAREAVANLEADSKDISHKIVSKQSKLSQSVEKLWKRKMFLLNDMMKKKSPDFSIILREMAKDYKKYTNRPLMHIDDYFHIANTFADKGELNEEEVETLRRYMQFANKDLPSIEAEEKEEAVDKEIFDEEIKELSKDNLHTAAKFRDVVKDDVREKFGEILKEVSEELDLPEGDVDKGEAMAAMTKTLDQLMNKLSGAGDKINKVQKHMASLKKGNADLSVGDQSVNLKRDNKMSVKKELREDRADIMPDEESEDEVEREEDEDVNSQFKDTLKQLQEAESEVESLEKEIIDLSKSTSLSDSADNDKVKHENDLENVKVSLTDLSPGNDALGNEQTEKIVKKLEGTIRDKLTKLGLDTGGRPIEVKLITTQIPEGLEEGMEGDKEDMQVQGMFFNMMTGNMQGYEDINSQRKVENNYKFSWNEQMVDDIEKKIDGLGGELPESTDVIQDQNEPEEIVLTDGANILDIFDGGDQRERPSSASNRMEEAIAVGENQNEEVFAQEEENLEREEL